METEDLGRESRDGERAAWTRPPCTRLRLSHLLVHQRGERQVVEQVCEVLPDVGVAVLPQTLVVEAVDLRDLPRLVVPSQDGDSLRETDLKESSRLQVCASLSTPAQRAGLAPLGALGALEQSSWLLRLTASISGQEQKQRPSMFAPQRVGGRERGGGFYL